MTYTQAIILGTVQGLTEFLPISSSGHLALGRHLLGLGEIGLTFDLLLHGATLLSVVIYFRSRLFSMIPALWDPRRIHERRMIGLLFLATLPIVAAGFLFKDPLERVSEHPLAVAALLCTTGVILLLPGWLRVRADGENTRRTALVMGFGQCIALLPGISRSGTTISLGCLAGLKPSLAAEFSFLMSIPAIVGAIVLKARSISAIDSANLGPCLAGMAAAFIVGMLAVLAVLTTIRKGKFSYFAIYCFAVGIIAFVHFGTSS